MSLVDHTGSVEYPYSRKTVFDAVMAASRNIDGFELDSADEMSGHLTLKAGVSWSSWGENIPIQLVSISPVRTKVEIISTPKTGVLFGGANDFGKNRRNIEKIISAISAQLAGKPAEVEETASSSPVSTADELLKLKQLKEEGILSEEEFNEQKQLLLKGKNNTPKTTAVPNVPTAATEQTEQPLVHIEGEKGGMNIGMVLFVIVIAVFLLIMFASM